MTLRNIAFVGITATYVGLWVWAFWPTIVLAIDDRSLDGLQYPAIPIALGLAVAVLMPIQEHPSYRGRRLVLSATWIVLLGVAAMFWIGLPVLTTTRPLG